MKIKVRVVVSRSSKKEEIGLCICSQWKTSKLLFIIYSFFFYFAFSDFVSNFVHCYCFLFSLFFIGLIVDILARVSIVLLISLFVWHLYSRHETRTKLTENLKECLLFSFPSKTRNDNKTSIETLRNDIYHWINLAISLIMCFYFKSKWVFFLYNRSRISAIKLVGKQWFDNVVLFFILMNCVIMAIERPSIKDGSTERKVIDVSNHIFTIVFTIEMCIKVGFKFPHVLLKFSQRHKRSRFCPLRCSSVLRNRPKSILLSQYWQFYSNCLRKAARVKLTFFSNDE